MDILIDTHCWLWHFGDSAKLNASSKALIQDPQNTIFFSAASSWEIAIKVALGKLKLPEDPKKYIPSRLAAQSMVALPIQHHHVLEVTELPLHHQDPFDRLLIAQAQLEKLRLLTADPQFKKYKVELIWAA